MLVLGTPGGSRIISMVLLGILDYVDSTPRGFRADGERPALPPPVSAGPYRVRAWRVLPEWVAALQAMGHTVQEGSRRWGNMQAVFVDRATGEATAYSDPRGKAGVLF